MPPDMTVFEVAKRLGVNPETVRLWLRAGAMRGYKLTPSRSGRGEWRIRETDLERFIAERANIPDRKV